jgi:uncharacterized protein (DUF2147 family)
MKGDPRYGKKVIGMEILQGLKKEGNEYAQEGQFLDPKNGKVYRCRIWLEGAESEGQRLPRAILPHSNVEKSTLNLH